MVNCIYATMAFGGIQVLELLCLLINADVYFKVSHLFIDCLGTDAKQL